MLWLPFGVIILRKEYYKMSPKALHRKLTKEANKKGLTGKRKDAYVYSVLNKIKKK